jgi:pantoate--beta-alanine ligase
MKILTTVDEVREVRKSLGNKTLGFVPTMGALHSGHLSLIEKAKSDNDYTIVSIFVNPTQFNDPNDLEKYPSEINSDIKKLEETQTDFLFYPNFEIIYNDNYRYQVIENDFSKELCGLSRKGHFEGVLTVVMKLLNIVNPDKAYFGEKDYQQYLLIRDMVKAFHMDVEIISSSIVRDSDGLALSSRNKLLSEEERNIAHKFFEHLNSNFTDEEVKNNLVNDGFQIDYIESKNNRRFGAVYLGNVRLIDNVEK